MTTSPDWLERALADVSRARVAVFGDFALDAYWELDPDESELSVETGKPVRKVRRQWYGLGGAGNVAANLAALGVGEVRAIGLVGRDLFGDLLLRLLDEAGVETGGVLRSDDGPCWQTPVFAKPQLEDVEQERIDFGAFNELASASFERVRQELEGAARTMDVVVLNQQIPVGASPSSVIAELNEVIRQSPRARFLVDSRDRPQEYAGAMLKLNEAEARRMQVDSRDQPHDDAGAMLELNEAEARRMRGDPRGDVVELVRRLQARVGAPVFVTRGARGIVAADDAGLVALDGVPVSGPTDPVGAGDAATGALAAALAGGADTATAAAFANLVAAVTVTKLRTTGTADPDELRALAARCE